MDKEEKLKLYQDVFAPKKGEKILFLVDIPHNEIKDNIMWKDRRLMAQEWYEDFKDLGEKIGISVKKLEYNATGMHGIPIPDYILDSVKKSNIIIAMTEFSASSLLSPICRSQESKTRGASMPLVERRMENTAFKADYKKVQAYAVVLKKMLDNAIGAKILFSTGDRLYIDLRNRIALLEAGDCTKPGQFINFPSGEAYISPYEGIPDEINKFGESKTEGIWPVSYNDEIIKYKIKKNRIIEIVGKVKKADEMRIFFNEKPSRRNIAELGIGCNPKAVVTGNPLEDEKVGLHIAYGTSFHLGGKITSDVHYDIIHAKNCPVEGITLSLLYNNGTSIEIIKDTKLRYDLLH